MDHIWYSCTKHKLNGYLSETLEPEVYDRNIIEVFYYLEDVNDACDETFTVVIK